MSSPKEIVILVCGEYPNSITLHEDLCSFMVSSRWIRLRSEKNFTQKL